MSSDNDDGEFPSKVTKLSPPHTSPLLAFNQPPFKFIYPVHSPLYNVPILHYSIFKPILRRDDEEFMGEKKPRAPKNPESPTVTRESHLLGQALTTSTVVVQTDTILGVRFQIK